MILTEVSVADIAEPQKRATPPAPEIESLHRLLPCSLAENVLLCGGDLRRCGGLVYNPSVVDKKSPSQRAISSVWRKKRHD
jgi:hypothetical protein